MILPVNRILMLIILQSGMDILGSCYGFNIDTARGNSHRTPYPTVSVIALSDTAIWIAMNGDQVAKWNGNTQDRNHVSTKFILNRKIVGRESKLNLCVLETMVI